MKDSSGFAVAGWEENDEEAKKQKKVPEDCGNGQKQKVLRSFEREKRIE